MEELVIELQSLLGKVKQKWDDLTNKERQLNQREEDINSKLIYLEEKHSELSSREVAVSEIESVKSTRDANASESNRISLLRSDLEGERAAFEKYKNVQLADINREKQLISNSWKELNAKQSATETEVKKRVDSFVSGLLKQGVK